jgi:hypothetical protein
MFFGPRPKALLLAVDWRFAVDRISAEITPQVIQVTTKAIKSLLFHVDDMDNSICMKTKYPSLLFFHFRISLLDVTVWTGDSQFTITAHEGANLEVSNLVTENVKSRFSITIPSVELSATAKSTTMDESAKISKWTEVANLTTSLRILNHQLDPSWKDLLRNQKDFVTKLDEEDRFSLLFDSSNRDSIGSTTPFYLFQPPFSVSPTSAKSTTTRSFVDLQSNMSSAHDLLG